MISENFKIILLTSILTISCNNEIPNAEINCLDLKESEGIVIFNDTKFSGSCFTIYDVNLEIDEIRTYRKGKRHGVWAKYYPNGLLRYQGRYKNEEIHGRYTEYYNNGSLKETGRLSKGYRDGEWFLYDENGKLIRKELHIDKELIDYETY